MRAGRALGLAALLAVAAPAHAGLGSLIGKLGRVAAEGGEVAAKGARAAGAGTALKGAKALGAAAAAERVFAHAAVDGARVGVFVADDGAGALRVVLEGGEELTHSPGSLRGMLSELDEMAQVTPEAGVDLFVDPDLLPRLGELELGANTRLWLANTDGASVLLRRGADGVAEVAAAESADGVRLWLRVTTDATKYAVQLASEPVGDRDVVVVDGDCGAVDGARTAASLQEALDGASGTVVVLATDPIPDDLAALAEAHGLDLVVLGLADVCPADAPAVPEAVACIGRARDAATLGALWAVTATVSAPLVLSDADAPGDWLALRGAGLAAAHRLTAAATPSDSDEPPLWFVAVAILAGVAFAGFSWLVAGRRRAAR